MLKKVCFAVALLSLNVHSLKGLIKKSLTTKPRINVLGQGLLQSAVKILKRDVFSSPALGDSVAAIAKPLPDVKLSYKNEPPTTSFVSVLRPYVLDFLPISTDESELKLAICVTFAYAAFTALITLLYLVSNQSLEDATFLPRDGFSDELWEVNNQLDISVASLLCPGPRWADSVSKLGLLSFPAAMAMFFVAGLVDLLWCFPLGFLAMIGVGAWYRGQIRRVYKLPKSPIADSVSWLFCCCCSIAQEARQIERDAFIARVVSSTPTTGRPFSDGKKSSSSPSRNKRQKSPNSSQGKR